MDNASPTSTKLPRLGLRLQHLRLISALADSGKISTAAFALNITQPAASRLAAEIENLLGLKIYARQPRGIELNDLGLALARRARAALKEIAQAEREVADLAAGRSGNVAIGTVTAPAIELVVPVLKKLRLSHPGIQASVQVETSRVLIRELVAGNLDLVLGRLPDDVDRREFSITPISPELATFAARRNHPLANRQGITLHDMAPYDWIMQPLDSPLRKTVEQMFQAANAPLPQRIVVTTSILLTSILVAETNAIAPLSLAVVGFLSEAQGAQSAICRLDVNVDPVVEPYAMIRLKDANESPALRLFGQLILGEIGQFGQGNHIPV